MSEEKLLNSLECTEVYVLKKCQLISFFFLTLVGITLVILGASPKILGSTAVTSAVCTAAGFSHWPTKVTDERHVGPTHVVFLGLSQTC